MCAIATFKGFVRNQLSFSLRCCAFNSFCEEIMAFNSFCEETMAFSSFCEEIMAFSCFCEEIMAPCAQREKKKFAIFLIG